MQSTAMKASARRSANFSHTVSIREHQLTNLHPESRALVRFEARDIAAVEANGTCIVAERAGEAVDEGGFARAVRSDKADALARCHH